MTPIRRLLVVLLVFALPVQGAIASSRWLCAAMTSSSAPAVHDPRGGHHDEAGRAATHAGHSMHEHGHAPGAAPGHAHAGTAAEGDAGCNLCAACSVTAGAPPAALVLAAVDRAEAPFVAPETLVPHVAASGPERPPRTI